MPSNTTEQAGRRTDTRGVSPLLMVVVAGGGGLLFWIAGNSASPAT